MACSNPEKGNPTLTGASTDCGTTTGTPVSIARQPMFENTDICSIVLAHVSCRIYMSRCFILMSGPQLSEAHCCYPLTSVSRECRSHYIHHQHSLTDGPVSVYRLPYVRHIFNNYRRMSNLKPSRSLLYAWNHNDIQAGTLVVNCKHTHTQVNGCRNGTRNR